jgi:hypothetical protein
MATLTPTLTLASNDISTTEALNLTITDQITVSGPCTTVIVPVSTNAKTIVTSGTSASIVFVYNTSANYLCLCLMVHQLHLAGQYETRTWGVCFNTSQYRNRS